MWLSTAERGRALVTQDMEKAEVHVKGSNAFITLVFTTKTGLQKSHASGSRGSLEQGRHHGRGSY